MEEKPICPICKKPIEEKDRVEDEETGDVLHPECLIKYVVDDLSEDEIGAKYSKVDKMSVDPNKRIPRGSVMCPNCSGPIMPLPDDFEFEGTGPGEAGSLEGWDAKDLKVCFFCKHLWALEPGAKGG